MAVWVNDRKLSQPPRLVFECTYTRNASPGQFCQNKSPVNSLYVQNPDVATRTRFGWTKLTVSEKVKLHCAPSQDGIGVTVTMNLAVKAQSSKKVQRVTHEPTGQYWDSDV